MDNNAFSKMYFTLTKDLVNTALEGVLLDKYKQPIYDEEGNKLLDFTCSWGPLIHGHSNPKIQSSIIKAIKHGTSFGTPTKRESILAKMIIKTVPSIEKVRMVSSGTEATMSAIRLARGYKRKDLII